MDLNHRLATANAALSATALACMLFGYRAIRRKDVATHRASMLAAAGASCAFLGVFVFRFVRFGFAAYAGHGLWRGVYLLVFFSHEPLAVVNVLLVVLALILAWRRSFRAHVEVARLALPIWVYVAVTGLVLYVLLYR